MSLLVVERILFVVGMPISIPNACQLTFTEDGEDGHDILLILLILNISDILILCILCLFRLQYIKKRGFPCPAFN